MPRRCVLCLAGLGIALESTLRHPRTDQLNLRIIHNLYHLEHVRHNYQRLGTVELRARLKKHVYINLCFV